MINRYQATLMLYSRRDGHWTPHVLGVYKTRYRASARLGKVVRRYTRYERNADYGEVLDLKTGCYQEQELDVRYDVPTVGDLGYTP